ncbi:hypothetical protein AAMO2058_001150500 [Amorphochlora amoebiformis]
MRSIPITLACAVHDTCLERGWGVRSACATGAVSSGLGRKILNLQTSGWYPLLTVQGYRHPNQHALLLPMGCSSSRSTDDVQFAKLYVPELKELATMLEGALKENFDEVETKVVDCPDLTKWGLAAPGIGGDPRIIDIGGVPNLLDPTYHGETFHIPNIALDVGLKGAYIYGAGAASSKVVGVNAELMPTEHVSKNCRCSRYSKVEKDGSHIMEKYDSSDIGLLANLVACKGEKGPVVMVRVKKRTGKENFVTCMRVGLEKALKSADSKENRQIGIGGVFKVVEGKVRGHVMPDFKPTVMVDGPEVEEWLQFYEMGPDLTCMSVFLTGDPTKTQDNPHGLDLRLEHTHFFSQSKPEGGHYHFDTTAENVEYVGYFIPVPTVYRVKNAFKREREKESLKKSGEEEKKD